jgi:hypothetical protein
VYTPTKLWWGNLKEIDHWGDPDVDGRIILGWIFRKWDVGVWTGLGIHLPNFAITQPHKYKACD